MPPVNYDMLSAMEKSCSKEKFLGGLEILLKLLTNIINDPSNSKYRSFKLENKTIKEKVLCISGMHDFLKGLGFVESSGTMTLNDTVLINDIRMSRDSIQSRYDALKKGGATGAADVVKAGPSKIPVEGRPKFHGKFSGNAIKYPGDSSSHPFLVNIDELLNQVLSYEDTALREFGRSLIPEEKLKMETLGRMRIIQKAIKSGNKKEEPVYEDLFIVVLTEWFNRSFFTWVNNVPCQVCGSEIGTRQTSYVENGIRVEEIFCCNRPTKFYRYNDIATLLVTRKGRCGEYANCFTFLCRCMGYDARYIFATFDHVWTEVYSFAQKRWIHVDPSDAVVDSPLMYQHGWKRPVDYVLAVSQYDVTDVTWRYSNEDRQALLRRRTRCPEKDLEAKLLHIFKFLQKGLSKAKRNFLLKRTLLESLQTFPIREPTEDEKRGRSSGDLAWREMRGEHSQDSFYVFNLTDEEARNKQFNLRYSAAKDVYETFLSRPAGQVTILSSSKSWNSRIYSSKNIIRKEEFDWKMVYLARNEDTSEAVIEWKFDFAPKKMTIKDVQLKFETKLYENAKIQLQFVTNKGEVLTDASKVKNLATFTIRATLTGGRGDNAWQHSQLFRQEMKSIDFPFELYVTFN